MSKSDILLRAAPLYEEGRRLWEESPHPAIPESDWTLAADVAAGVYQGDYAAEFAAACQCFYLFRRLHRLESGRPGWETLLGDFFFSRFSKCLIPLDSIPLSDAFAAFLAADTQKERSKDEYLAFVRGLPAVIGG